MRVNEIFYSLQGEGRYTGTPAVFIRLAGCNLKCSFCDTNHEPYVEMTEQEITDVVAQYAGTHVVITGGEPTLQLTSTLVDKLHALGKDVQVETNGTIALNKELLYSIDWITCSPKNKPVKIQRINELKVVYQQQDMRQYEFLYADEYYLQPCDVKDAQRNAENTTATIEYIKAHPKWKLSLQTQKILNVR